MNHRSLLSAAVLVGVLGLAIAGPARGDAAGDLAAGRAALAAGDLDKALPLLVSAAQALPDSVEAQMALAQAQLQAGQVDKALDAYRKVLKLSPDHAQAKKIVAALTGQRTTLEQRLASARTLIDVGAFDAAQALLRQVLAEPVDPPQRDAARLLIAEAALWAGNSDEALTQALRLVQESADAAATGPAKVIAALALTGKGPERAKQAADLAKEAGQVAAPWAARAELVNLLARLTDPTATAGAGAADIALKLGPPLGVIPVGGFRSAVVGRAANELLAVATARLGQGDLGAATAIVWPLVGVPLAPPPAPPVVAAPMPALTGWLGPREAEARLRAVDVLAATGRAEIEKLGAQASLWRSAAAAQALLYAPAEQPADLERYTARLLALAADLGSLSRPAPDRVPGAVLSTADALQQDLIAALVSRLTTEAQRGQLVDLVLAQVQRYQQAGDVETGLQNVVALNRGADPARGATLNWPTGLDRLPPGPAQQKLEQALAQKYAELGQRDFAIAAAQLDPKANEALNGFDVIAVLLLGDVAARYPGAATGTEAIFERYAAAGKWAAATEAVTLYYTLRPAPGEAAKWALARVKLRQATGDEDKLLAAQHALPDPLGAAVKQALADVAALVKARPTKATVSTATTIIGPLVDRYAALERLDLAEAVIATVTAAAGAGPAGPAPATQPALAGGGGPIDLSDWALWMRANLQEGQAARALGRLAKEFDGAAKLPLSEFHQAELALLTRLVKEHPRSDYIPQVAERVIHIATTYQNYKSFDTAAAVLGDFLKANPGIAPTPRLEYQIVLVLLAKATYAFEHRPDKANAPTQIGPESAAALDALAVFLKAHPTGEFAPSAEENLLAIARTYGQVGAWNLSREVLARFAKAVPDFRAPAYLKLLEAATYLGELDRAYGLALLTPLPAAPTSGGPGARPGRGGAGGFGGGGGGLAVAGGTVVAAATDAELVPLQIELPPAMAYGTPARAPAGAQPGGAPNAPATPAVQPPADLNAALVTFDDAVQVPRTDQALAMIRQSEQRGLQQFALANGNGNLTVNAIGQSRQAAAQVDQQGQGALALPGGPVLSEAELKRQDDAADKAYALLIDLVKAAKPTTAAAGAPGVAPAPAPGPAPGPGVAAIADQARLHVIWLFGFFEHEARGDRALALIRRYLTDRPTDPARLALSYRAIADQLAWAGQRRDQEKLDQAWLDQRHDLFEKARQDLTAFITAQSAPPAPAPGAAGATVLAPDRIEWAHRARLLLVDSYQQEAAIARLVSAVRAGGLLVQSAEALLALAQAAPDHPEAGSFPQRLAQIATALVALQQNEQAIFVYSQIPIRFPTHPLAREAVLQIAGLYAANLSAPLRAVETYQEYLSLAGDNESIRSQVFSIGQQLSAKQRYLEALHVYGVFVDSFPTDPRAPEALRAIGQIHQANEAWPDALATYQRILDEYKNVPIAPQVKLAIAECEINLSQWKAARKLYEEYLTAYPSDAQAALAKSRIEVLKSLDRYQTLLADDQIKRNKDDAQFQIGRIVNEQLANPVKAVIEFRKVVKDYANSRLAAEAQFEIGKALLALNRIDEARTELLKVPTDHPTSPLAGSALYLVGQSYERQAERLAAVTGEKAKQELFESNQRIAYQQFQDQAEGQNKLQISRRSMLKSAGKGTELALEEAYGASRFNGMNNDSIANFARQAELKSETESALQAANRQDRINEAYRQAVALYGRTAAEYPLSDATDKSLLRMAQIYETQLKDRAKAMETYQKVVKFFPGTPVAEDAAWKVAKFYEAEGKYEQAVTAYKDFIRNYPASARAADAQFAMAEDLEQQGRWVEAMEAYQTFRDKFTAHPKAAMAQEQIQWIKAYR